MSNKKCTGQSSINFAILAGIRGTTPLMLWFAVMNLQSAGMVVAIKCGITLLLFLISTIWYFWREDDGSKHIILKNLANRGTYWKICKNVFFIIIKIFVSLYYNLQLFALFPVVCCS